MLLTRPLLCGGDDLPSQSKFMVVFVPLCCIFFTVNYRTWNLKTWNKSWVTQISTFRCELKKKKFEIFTSR